MTAEPPSINAPPRKRLGCVAKLATGLLAGVVMLIILGNYLARQEERALVERATAALLTDPATALTILHEAHRSQPDDEAIARLYQDAQQKWLESIDRQIAEQTPAQRYSTLEQSPVSQLRKHLSEPLAAAFQQFLERNRVETQRQIQETVERAMDLVEAAQFREGWEAMETLRVCNTFPELPDLWRTFDTFNAARQMIHAGDLAQNEQIAAARDHLIWMQKNRQPTPQDVAEAGFRIDLGDFNLHLNQAVRAAAKGDAATAQARLAEVQPLLSRLLASTELQDFFADLPEKDRGSPLINQLNAAQSAVRQAGAKAPGR
jgi:curved DNA-binding protein CbpA